MNETFLKACRGEKVPYTPIWIMRQAGRVLPDYRELAKKYDFLALCKTPELAARVTVQPVDALGVDAAIFFSDILTTVEPMGMQLQFARDTGGPRFLNPVRTKADVERLTVPDPEVGLKFVKDAVAILKKELADKVPLIGFAGGPFTVATYMIEGANPGKSFLIKRMLYENPDLLRALLDKVTRLTAAYLQMQVKAGANAAMLFDSWAGILSQRDYVDFVLPGVKQINESLKNLGVPIIYFALDGTSFYSRLKDCGADVIVVDYRERLDHAIRHMPGVSIMGNLDPFALFAPLPNIEERVKEILDYGAKARGHIFSLGHGIMNDSPLDNVKALVQMVHRLSKRS